MLLLVLLGAAGGMCYWLTRPSRLSPDDRVAYARKRELPFIQRIFRDVDIPYPPARIYLRAFKTERRLELWASPGADEPFQHVHNFTIRRSSGNPGPKRREGDRQVPEGFYKIDRFNPRSSFFLSLGLDYPNASDCIRSDPAAPGSDIFLHGGGLTIGCLPLGDDGIGALYTIATDAGNRNAIPVHIFPSARHDGQWKAEIEALAAADPALAVFWAELAPALDQFERTRTLPEVIIAEDGSYH